ncbi:hypothetical protein YW7DRAFT_05971 [Streptomyces sp. AmelKG-E11A]|nr:hypothetical protein YW7DRAFT_05971 [Streptomyces sp. AmelKG-E11A]
MARDRLSAAARGAEYRLLPREIGQTGADLSDLVLAKISQGCSGTHVSDLILSALQMKGVSRASLSSGVTTMAVATTHNRTLAR